LLLDTDFLIDILRKNPPAIKVLEELIIDGFDLYVSHVNLWELYQGAYRTKSVESNVKNIDDFTDHFFILEFTKETNKTFGRLITQLNNEGTPIGVLDTLLASIALVNNFPIVTRNVKHFNKTGVQIKTW
jgi:predicted nucleic acid-binding protein